MDCKPAGQLYGYLEDVQQSLRWYRPERSVRSSRQVGVQGPMLSRRDRDDGNREQSSNSRQNARADPERSRDRSPARAGPRQLIQRTAGNQAIQRAARRSEGSALRVGKPNDRYEREAERMAEAVTRSTDAAAGVHDAAAGVHETEPTGEQQTPQPAERGGGLQRSGSTPTPPVTEDVRKALQSPGSGRPLSTGVRTSLEPQFGRDFGSVRLHDGERADRLCDTLAARAFTHGRDIYLGSDADHPGTRAGTRLLAHELTHVVQQGHADGRSTGQDDRPTPGRAVSAPDGQQTATPDLQRQGGPYPDPSKPAPVGDARFLHLRVSNGGQVELLVREPGLPVGTIGLGVRFTGSSPQLIGSGDPLDLGDTYSVEDARELVREEVEDQFGPESADLPETGRLGSPGAGVRDSSEMGSPDPPAFDLSGAGRSAFSAVLAERAILGLELLQNDEQAESDDPERMPSFELDVPDIEFDFEEPGFDLPDLQFD